VASTLACDGCSVITFKVGQTRFEKLTPRHDHDVKAWRQLVTTKNLSYQTFSSIPLHGTAQLFRSRDAKTSDLELVGPDEERAESASDTRAMLVDLLKIGPSTEPLVRAEATGRGQRDPIRC
jgi:hypothetical protein